MKKYIFLLVGLIFLLGFIGLIGAEKIDEKSSKVNEKVLKEIEKNGKADVIVTLKNNDGLAKNSNQKIERQISEKSFSAELNEKEISKLLESGKIERIEYNYPIKILLDDSAGIINATSSWSKTINNLNLTGLGETICVIDTGTNYSHPDLGGCSESDFTSGNCQKVIAGYDFGSNDNNPMDVDGHGTHVSGTAAGNGSVDSTRIGIAREANIVSLKVFDDSGSGTVASLVSAINWCVGNSTLYNISVITMSIGLCDGSPCESILETAHCDSDFVTLRNAVNSAFEKNISVSISSGNDGSTTAIGVPACLSNATAIGATDKSDAIASYSNRNSLLKLLAPGGTGGGVGECSDNNRICAPYKNGGYKGLAGTSMATPHAAGAIAIMNQFLEIVGETRTPEEIENTLNESGKAVGGFSRINILEAVTSLDENAPSVTLVSPTDNFLTGNKNQTFLCNATDFSLKNVTFYLWNSSDVFNLTSDFIPEREESYNLEVNQSSLPFGTYLWNCLAEDWNENSAFASANFSFTIGINTSLGSPENNKITNKNQSFFCAASSSSDSLANASFYIWNSSGFLENLTTLNLSGLVNASNFSYNFSYEDTYSWNCLFVTNTSVSDFASANFSITYDLIKPNLTILSPSNNSWSNVAKFNISISESGNCSVSLDSGTNNLTLNTTNYLNFSFVNSSIAQGNYNATYYCSDSAGNLESEGRHFNIDLTEPVVTLLTPANGDSSFSGTTNVNFTYNVTDNLNVTSCNIVLNNVAENSNASAITNETNTIIQSVGAGTHTWGVNCTDEAGNQGNSSARSITINPAPSSVTTGGGSGGGGGGGTTLKTSGAATYAVTDEQITGGYTKALRKDDRVKFSIFDEKAEEHILTIEEIQSNFVRLTISSEPTTLVLGVGQSAKLNLTSPDYYNLYIKLEAIENDFANLTIQSIHEEIPKMKIEEKKEEDEKEPVFKEYYVWAILGIVLLIGIIVFILRMRKMKKEIIKEVKRDLKKAKKRKR